MKIVLSLMLLISFNAFSQGFEDAIDDFYGYDTDYPSKVILLDASCKITCSGGNDQFTAYADLFAQTREEIETGMDKICQDKMPSKYGTSFEFKSEKFDCIFLRAAEVPQPLPYTGGYDDSYSNGYLAPEPKSKNNNKK